MKDIHRSDLESGDPSDRNEEPLSPNVRKRSPYLLWLVWLVWLPLVIPTILKSLQSHYPLTRLVIALLGVALFFALYLWSSWRRAWQLVSTPTPSSFIDASAWLVIIAMSALSIVLMLLAGSEWEALFFYTSGYVGGSLPTRRVIPVALVLMLIALGIGWLEHLPLTDLGQIVVFVPAIVFITKCVMWSITTSWELQAAREEIARLAVMTERLRIARDLHDLLGHNLSLITLKSELAGRLIAKAPERAAAEINDIEQVARTTLQEVREAVASYRQPTLASELQAAREILNAGGILYSFEGDEQAIGTFPTSIESALAWTVREGVTNVIRHSHARHCAIRIERGRQSVLVEIKNDGVAAASIQLRDETVTHAVNSTTNSNGNGLRGLAERIAVLGGRLQASPEDEGGFHLTVSIPLSPKASSSARQASLGAFAEPAQAQERSVQS